MSLLDEEDVIVQETEKIFDEQLLYYMTCSKLETNPLLNGFLHPSQMKPDTVYACARESTIWNRSIRGYWIGNREKGWKKCTCDEYLDFLKEYLNKNNITIK